MTDPYCRSGYIAGVTNPIFETAGEWDLLCDISSSRMVVSKDILIDHPPTAIATSTSALGRTATLKTEGSLGSEEDMLRPGNMPPADKKGEYKSDNDNLFMEDVRLMLQSSGLPILTSLMFRSLLPFLSTSVKPTFVRALQNIPGASCALPHDTRKICSVSTPLLDI